MERYVLLCAREREREREIERERHGGERESANKGRKRP
jgi:hypothetical protein